MNIENSNQLHSSDENLNIRVEIEKYLVNWKWFALSLVFFLFLAFLYLKSQVNVYETKSTLLFKGNNASSELDLFRDLSAFGVAPESNVVDEIELLKSRTLLEKVVRELDLNQVVKSTQGLKEVELYDNNPIKLEVLSNKNEFYTLDTIIDITILNNIEFEYEIESADEIKLGKFGEKISVGKYEFLLTPNRDVKEETEIQLVFNTINKVLDKFNSDILIESITDHSNVISVIIEHPIRSKAQLILNTLIDTYNYQSIEDKNIVGKKTDEFITNRLKVIKVELDEIDKLEEIYKKEQQLTDIVIQSKVYVDGQTENDQAIFRNETDLRMIEFMIEDIESQKEEFKLLPSNITAESRTQLSESVNQFNKLLFERNRLLSSSYMENPVVQNLNNELQSLRNNINVSLHNTKTQLEISLKSLKEKEQEFNNRISEIPKKAREYTAILREQKIIAELYSYLLQKKQENEISMAVMVSDAKVVDRAYSERNPISPKKKIILFVGLLLGVIVPFGVIYVIDMLDTKFHSRAELEKHVSIPILGDIPFDKSEEKVIIKQGSRTSSAEAFRLLRTNLDFILSSVTTKSKVIFVTSTISGEGKTFVSVNTASSISLTGKKVLLIGMDLRAPKITQYLGLPNRSGVSNYLIGQETNVSDLVFPLPGYENLNILSSGIVPPNPAELLLNERLDKMFEELREHYDYIVVDTAPVNLVTDTLMMSKHADMFVYVARANYLDKRMLELSEKLYREKRLPNMAMLINGMDHERVYGYGVYGYGGYGYPDEEDNKNFFQRLFKR